jgi:hypothetical protein
VRRAGGRGRAAHASGGTRLVWRRSWASLGPLLGFLALTALVVACVVTALGVADEALRTTLRADPSLAGDGSSITYTTREGPDPAAQDELVRSLIGEATGGANTDVSRETKSGGSGDVPLVAWTVAVDAETVTATDVTRLAVGLPSLEASLKASPAQHRGLVATGRLAETMPALAERVTIFRAVAIAPLLALVAVGAVGLGRLAQQLVAGRNREDVLLYARGLSTGQAVRLAVLEAGVVALLGSLLGAGMALTGVALLGSPGAVSGGLLAQAGWAAGLATVGVTVMCAVLVRRQGLALTRGVIGRTRRSAIPALTLVAAAAVAAVATWRIRSAGTTAGDLDVLAVISPGLLLVALLVLVLTLAGPLLDLVARFVSRGRSLAGTLAARGAARRGSLRLPALMAGLAAALLVLGASYSATGEVRSAIVAHTEAGADVRLVVESSGPVAPAGGTSAGEFLVSAPDGASLALTATGSLSQDEVRLTALPKAAMPGVLRGAPGDGEQLAQLVTGKSPSLHGIPLATSSGGSTEVRLGLESLVVYDKQFETDWRSLWGVAEGMELPPGFDPPRQPAPKPLPVRAQAWFADEGGALVLRSGSAQLPAVPDGTAPGPTGARVPLVIEPDLPEPVGAWRLVGLDLTVGDDRPDWRTLARENGTVAGARVGLDRVGDGTGQLPSGVRWAAAASIGAPTGALPLPSDGPTVMDDAASLLPGQELRLVPTPGQEPEPVRLVVTDAVAVSFDLKPGDRTQLRVGGATIDAVVVDTRARVPGTSDAFAALLDLDALHEAQLHAGIAPSRAEEVWLAASGGSQTRRADVARDLVDSLRIHGAAPEDPARIVVIRDVAGADVSVAFWTSALAALLLALAGLNSTGAAQGIARRAEVVALRALRLPPRTQAWVRGVELGTVTAVGIVAGLLVGAVVAALAVPILVGASSGAVDGSLVPDAGLGRLALGLLALLLGVAVVVGVHSRRVARTARDLDLREEDA